MNFRDLPALRAGCDGRSLLVAGLMLAVLCGCSASPLKAQTKSKRTTKLAAVATNATGQSLSERTLKVCVASGAPPEVRAAAQAILAASGTSPLLQSFTGGGAAPTQLSDTSALMAAKPEERAYSHLVVVGMPDDPLIKAAWQREASVSAAGSLYVFGFGNFSGNVGYIESDRNPFLHGIAIKMAPFETEVVTITGTTPAGVVLAAHAFLERGLVNGVVAGPGWKRPESNLLERDPLTADFALPTILPAMADDLPRIAVTQASEDEYRGVLQDTGIEPLTILRAKYHRSDAWDGVGAAASIANYVAGLHRRAYGDTLWCARFPSAAAAKAAAPKIAHAANLRAEGTSWSGKQAPYDTTDSGGPLSLWQHGDWLIMSTLPDTPTRELMQTMEASR